MIQRAENYFMDCARSGSRVQRVAAVIVLAAAGIVALGVGALAAFAQIAALYLVAGYMGATSPAGPALVIVVVMWVGWQVWLGLRTWWRR